MRYCAREGCSKLIWIQLAARRAGALSGRLVVRKVTRHFAAFQPLQRGSKLVLPGSDLEADIVEGRPDLSSALCAAGAGADTVGVYVGGESAEPYTPRGLLQGTQRTMCVLAHQLGDPCASAGFAACALCCELRPGAPP